MTFVNLRAKSALIQLKSKHYPFPRADRLREVFSWCVTDYFAKAEVGKGAEVSGLLVTGESRVGKTDEVNKLVSAFNEAKEILPSGKPARIIICLLEKKDSWKEMGLKTLGALGYRIESRRTRTDIWRMVHELAKEEGVVGIVYDECQHIFSKNEIVNDEIRDRFKTLLKDRTWPLMLILSGVPRLGERIQGEEALKGEHGIQLASLLRPVHFDTIAPEKDLEEINEILYVYSDAADLRCDRLSNKDFLERLAYACVDRWGLVIEIIIEALVRAKASGKTEVALHHFVEAYSSKTGLRPGFSPFTAPDYQDAFDQVNLLRSMLKEG